MLDVTIATHGAMPGGSTDDRLLAGALASAGARVQLSVWNDPDIDWSRSGRIVIRSTWDYHLDPIGWFRWLSAASSVSRVINDSGVVRWNSDKRYLLDLEAAGVAIVPTQLVTRDRPVDLAGLCARPWLARHRRETRDRRQRQGCRTLHRCGGHGPRRTRRRPTSTRC